MRKIPMRLCGTKFCTSSARFAPSFVRQPNGPKWYETHQNMRLGSNGVDRVRSSLKTPKRPRRTNFCTNSECFALSFVRQLNGPKCTQMVRNAPKLVFRVQWGGSGAFVAKNSDTSSCHELLHLFKTFCPEFCKATEWSQNAPKWYEMQQNESLGSNGVDRVCSSRKLRCNFVARTFALVRPVLHRVS